MLLAVPKDRHPLEQKLGAPNDCKTQPGGKRALPYHYQIHFSIKVNSCVGSLIWGTRPRRPNLEVTKKAKRARINFLFIFG